MAAVSPYLTWRFVDKWNLGSLGKFVIDQRLQQEHSEANLGRKFTAVNL